MGKGSRNTTVSNEPNKIIAPHLRSLYRAAKHQRTKDLDFFPGSTVAGFNPTQRDAFSRIASRARSGSAVGNAAQDYIGNIYRTGGAGGVVLNPTAGGDFVDLYSSGQTPGGAFLRDTTQGQFLDRYGTDRTPGGGLLSDAAGGRFLDAYQSGDVPGGDVIGDVTGGRYLDAYTAGQVPGGGLLASTGGGDAVAAYLAGQGGGGANLGATSSGAYLHSNPYLDATFGSAARGVTEQFQNELLPGLNATFSDAGRTSSGGHQLLASDVTGEVTDSLSDLAADIYGGNFQAERDRQLAASDILNRGYLTERGFQEDAGRTALQGYLAERGLLQDAADLGQRGYLAERGLQQDAANVLNQGYLTERGLQQGAADTLNQGYLTERGFQQDAGRVLADQGLRASALAPQLAGLDYQDLQALLGIGDQQQRQSQAEIDAARERFEFERDAKHLELQRYASLLGPTANIGGQGTQRAPRGNPFTGALGGALSGAALGSYIPAVGTGIGAVGGGLLGILGAF